MWIVSSGVAPKTRSDSARAPEIDPRNADVQVLYLAAAKVQSIEAHLRFLQNWVITGPF